MTIKKNSNTPEYFFEEGCYITEFWNENSDESVSIAKARLSPGGKTRKHRLKNTAERYLILSGHGTVFLDDEPGIAITADDVVYIDIGREQSIVNSGTQDLVFLVICNPRFKAENYIDSE